MRITIAIDLDIADGKRPGTRYGRAERVAQAIGAFAQRLSAVKGLRSVEVRQGPHPEAVLMAFGASEARPLHRS